jgi:hypothetical protein
MQQHAVSSVAQEKPLSAVGVTAMPSQAVNGVVQSVGMQHMAVGKVKGKGKVIQQGLRLLGSLMDWTERETHRDSDFRRESRHKTRACSLCDWVYSKSLFALK